jgi:EAL and modified HD-GYP domain-containing signal transduction protein
MLFEVLNFVLLARQPIFDADLNLFAYELLFRSTYENASGVPMIDGDKATTEVINRTFLELGIEKVLGNKRGFINLTRSFLTGERDLPFDSSQIVLEVLEDIEIDEQILESINNLNQQGYVIALDDFIFKEELRPAVQAAHIIKIDLLALSEQELIEHVTILKKENVKLLAEKVETEQQFELCKKLGFEYFQGYFFCKPTIINDKPLPDNKASALRILSELQKDDIDIDSVEILISQDASLSYKLLRTLNSAAFGLPRKIESIRQGITMLGPKTIKSWVTIIAYSDAEASTSELLTTALVRAKMSELLADSFGCIPDTAFLVGLFSPLDAILQKPMDELLQTIPLNDDVKHALLNGDGKLGNLLNFVIPYEQNEVMCIPNNVSIEALNSAYLEATEWTDVITSSI